MNDEIRVLLVDDNPEDRVLVIRELRRDFANLQINQVTDAKHFARALESGKGDLVITDYRLRWSDGLAVLRAIKDSWPECPVIMFTGTGSEEVAVEAMKAGLDDYVLKAPSQYARLPGVVRRAFERKTQLQALKEAENRYLKLFNDLPVGLYKTTPAGKILDANPAVVQMLGYPDRASLLKVTAADLWANPADLGRWQRLLGGDSVVRGLQTQLRRRDGSFISVEENIRAVRDADDQVLISRAASKTSPSDSTWRRSYGIRRKWNRLASSRLAWPMTSTTCSPSSKATPTCCWRKRICRPSIRDRWKGSLRPPTAPQISRGNC